jgi:hypothetical protein
MPDIFFDSLLNEIERLESQNKFLKQAIIDAGNYLLKQAEEV